MGYTYFINTYDNHYPVDFDLSKYCSKNFEKNFF